MSDIHKSLRLGDLLVERGLISAPQLRDAINLQKSRCENPDAHPADAKCEIGEILIELGFISRSQLKANLSWQRRLKATTAMMVFVAPLLTAACGGGSGGGSSAAQPSPDVVAAGQVAPKSSAAVSSSSAQAVSSAKASSTPIASSISSAKSSAPSVASSKSSASSAPKSSSSVASSNASGYIDGAAQLLWSVPTSRENGELLDITEIGGYEVRYKLKSDVNYTSIIINDGFIDAYYFNYLKGEYEFQIATFDKTGLYSKFISINPAG